jgi:hypothetical protein
MRADCLLLLDFSIGRLPFAVGAMTGGDSCAEICVMETSRKGSTQNNLRTDLIAAQFSPTLKQLKQSAMAREFFAYSRNVQGKDNTI